MLALIDYIKTALSQTHSIEEALDFLPMSFKKDFPVAYVHSETRVKDEKTKIALKTLFNKEGLSSESLSEEELSLLKDMAPELLQEVSYICLRKQLKTPMFYSNKYKNDFWKKIQSIEAIQAVFDISKNTDETPCLAEFNLREVMRKRKEVHQLKSLGFIYLMESEHDLSKLCEHYFDNKYLCINGKYYLAYAKVLKDVNMRYFLCAPKMK